MGVACTAGSVRLESGCLQSVCGPSMIFLRPLVVCWQVACRPFQQSCGFTARLHRQPHCHQVIGRSASSEVPFLWSRRPCCCDVDRSTSRATRSEARYRRRSDVSLHWRRSPCVWCSC
jgi:hypothetical protein